MEKMAQKKKFVEKMLDHFCKIVLRCTICSTVTVLSKMFQFHELK